MKFTCSTEINQPIEKVFALFKDDSVRKQWQQGFVSAEPISGTPGEAGSKAKIIFQAGKKTLELDETILTNNPPYEFSGLYEHVHMTNTMSNRFTSIGENKTRYDAAIDYTKFVGFMPKLMAFLMPGFFKKQVQKMLDSFKTFAEKQ